MNFFFKKIFVFSTKDVAHGELVWWVWDSRRCRCRAAGSHTSDGALLHIHTLPKLSFTGDDFFFFLQSLGEMMASSNTKTAKEQMTTAALDMYV